MCVNEILLKTAYKSNHLSIIILKTIYYVDRTSFSVVLGAHAVDKRRKEGHLTTSIAFLLLNC